MTAPVVLDYPPECREGTITLAAVEYAQAEYSGPFQFSDRARNYLDRRRMTSTRHQVRSSLPAEEETVVDLFSANE